MTILKKFYRSSYVQLGVAVIFIVIDLVFVGLSAGLSKSDWAAWFGAVGTIGALIGTVWIASDTKIQRRREAITLATLTSASLILRLTRYKNALLTANDLITDQSLGGIDLVVRYSQAHRVLAQVEGWQPSELVPLAVLPHHAAAKLALSYSVATGVQNRMAAASDGPASNATALREVLTSQIEYAVKMLEIGIKECTKLMPNVEIGMT